MMEIAVLMGGVSGEREVSLMSGKAVVQALKRLGYTVHTCILSEPNLDSLADLHPDLVFIALHGKFGEDGEVQTLLEERGLAFTGCGVEASRIAMDKQRSKQIFQKHQIPTPKFYPTYRSTPLNKLKAFGEELGYPLIVKPSQEGSSLGISKVMHPKNLMDSIKKALEFGETALIEEFIAGKEFTVGILGEEVLPLVQIRTKRDFYDYFAKYKDDSVEYLFDSEITPQEKESISFYGKAAFKVIGGKDLGRVDVILGKGGPQVLEVNTIPGMTSHSLIPKAASHYGLNFDQLCDRIVQMALARHKNKTSQS
ncbi:MAG: D-alanine--D-alanine ligase [Planctomycetota bacterium]